MQKTSVNVTRSFSLLRPKVWSGWIFSIPFTLGLYAFEVIGSPNWPTAIGIGILIGSMAFAWRDLQSGEPGWRRDAQLGGIATVLVFLASQMTPFALPIMLLFLAVSSLLVNARTAASFAALSVILWILKGDQTVTTLAVDVGFIVAFAGLGSIVAGAHAFAGRLRVRKEIESQREHLIQQAAEFRLLAPQRDNNSAPREQAQEMIHRHAVDAVNHSIYLSLSLLKTGLRCHTVVLLWFDVSNQKLQIKELVSDSDEICEADIPPAKGVIGGITRRREPIKLNDLRDGFRGLPYYRKTPSVKSFVGVPILEDGRLRGVICADRISEETFTDEDVELISEAASYIVRTVENERLFASIEKSKYELGRFFEASKKLNTVLTTEQALPVILQCVADIAPYEYAALTLLEGETHRVVSTDTIKPLEATVGSWLGKTFESNSGLVAMAVRNRHYLPYGGNLREKKTTLFTEREIVPPTESLLVIPLIAQDSPVGTLVVGHSRPNIYSTERREMLEVVANQSAVTLLNAQMYEQMKEMATTDGLTGLANHRTFQARMDEAIARHRRSGEKLCLLLTDIDHFKKVNDTYGHPAGDEVLRQVAACFAQSLRETDIPCRYGGEEFAIILENTEIDGAMVIADRIRESIKALEFSSDSGDFSCTLSIGVAGWPDDALEKQTLVDLADQALYEAKETGRDQVVAFRALGRDAG